MLALPVSVGVGDLLVFWGEGLIKEAGSFPAWFRQQQM